MFRVADSVSVTRAQSSNDTHCHGLIFWREWEFLEGFLLILAWDGARSRAHTSTSPQRMNTISFKRGWSGDICRWAGCKFTRNLFIVVFFFSEQIFVRWRILEGCVYVNLWTSSNLLYHVSYLVLPGCPGLAPRFSCGMVCYSHTDSYWYISSAYGHWNHWPTTNLKYTRSSYAIRSQCWSWSRQILE